MRKLYTSVIVLILFNLCYNSTLAQTKKGEFISASVGLGMVAPSDESDIVGSGFYVQGEYIWNMRSWFGVRPYAGFVTASGGYEEPELQEYNVKSNAFLLGAKVRLTGPIPYVAPFVELGVGMSAGSFQTYTPFTNLKKNGVLLHVPFSLGLAMGRKHDVEVKFTYYHHPAVKQFSGAAAVGLSFPLDRK